MNSALSHDEQIGSYCHSVHNHLKLAHEQLLGLRRLIDSSEDRNHLSIQPEVSACFWHNEKALDQISKTI